MYIQQEGNVFDQNDLNKYNKFNPLQHVEIVVAGFDKIYNAG